MSQSRQHIPRKRFGQNFLHDPGVISRIIKAINPLPDDRIIEIGPGLGALTDPILEQVKFLQVIELDRELGGELKDRYAENRCHVHIADALKFDFSSLTDSPQSLRIIGNLPYNISTPMMFHLLRQHVWIKDMHFMLQKEVVDRMIAQPGSRDYGRLSIMLQIHCRCDCLFQVGPGAFRPAPKVESAVVRLIPHQHTLVDGPTLETLDQIVRRMFSSRRKTIRNGLRGLLEATDIEHCAVDPGQRPEQLNLDQLIRLATRLSQLSDS